MAYEKLFTAKQAAKAVLDKAKEVLEKHEQMEKCGTFSKVHSAARREGYSEESADKIAGKAKAMEKAEGKWPKGEIHPKEKDATPPDGEQKQVAPEKNPKEQAEGNNELAGTTPNQVGQDGKNLPGYDEMKSQDQMKGHLKLAKFIGRMDHKRSSKMPR